MTSLTLVRRIRAQPAIVFAALTTAEGITHWWGPDEGPVLFAESDARVGGRFRVRFRLVDGSEHEASGEYLEVVDCKRLVMSWQWVFGGEPDERGQVSQVEVDLRAIDIGTELTFTHALPVGPVGLRSGAQPARSASAFKPDFRRCAILRHG
jgi:uncharacterized protein YndB with AHSA1/START domain